MVRSTAYAGVFRFTPVDGGGMAEKNENGDSEMEINPNGAVHDGLLYPESDLRIEEHYTDTAAFTAERTARHLGKFERTYPAQVDQQHPMRRRMTWLRGFTICALNISCCKRMPQARPRKRRGAGPDGQRQTDDQAEPTRAVKLRSCLAAA